jgi:elongation factor P hydroxylase
MGAKGQWCSLKKNTKGLKSIGYKNTPDKSQETTESHRGYFDLSKLAVKGIIPDWLFFTLAGLPRNLSHGNFLHTVYNFPP